MRTIVCLETLYCPACGACTVHVGVCEDPLASIVIGCDSCEWHIAFALADILNDPRILELIPPQP